MMNQKNHFVSTYQKDYTAPDVYQTEPSTKPIAIKFCPCTDSIRLPKELILDPSLDRDRTEIPKISKIRSTTQPIRVAKVQLEWPTSVFLKKREKKCPDLDEKLLQKICSDEKTARTDADRFKTTYQAHYSDPAAARMTQRDLGQAIIRIKDQQLRCRMPIKIMIEADCPPPCHPSSSRDELDVKHKLQDYKLRNGSGRDKNCDALQTKLPSWKSEYQDSISKIGHAVMRAKLHHSKRKAFPLQYQNCTTSN